MTLLASTSAPFSSKRLATANMTLVARDEKRRTALVVGLLNIRAFREQDAHRLDVAHLSRDME